MSEFTCKSRDPLGCLVETKHGTIGFALLEGQRRKELGHSDVTIDNGTTPPPFSANPGDVPTWRNSKPKPIKRRAASKRDRTSVMEAL